MITLMLKKKTKSLKTKTSSSKGKGKKKKDEDSTFEESDDTKNPKSSSEEEKNLDRSVDHHLKRMTEFENRLEAIAHRGDLQEVGVVRPYLVEWDAALYSPKFKAPILYTFDGKGSPNQHIYYFKSQTENVISNIAIMAHLLLAPSNG